ncbi:MAG TPA: hypothetical protein VEC60_21670 [Reyranella sp.]|nr:hypothetical protein [Reyranella sp.]
MLLVFTVYFATIVFRWIIWGLSEPIETTWIGATLNQLVVTTGTWSAPTAAIWTGIVALTARHFSRPLESSIVNWLLLGAIAAAALVLLVALAFADRAADATRGEISMEALVGIATGMIISFSVALGPVLSAIQLLMEKPKPEPDEPKYLG